MCPGKPIQNLLFIRSGKRMVPVCDADIMWVSAAGNYARIHTYAETYLVRSSLTALCAALDDTSFVRIHKSTLVNLAAVAELQQWFSGEMLVCLKDGTQLKMSRKHRQEIQQRVRFL